MKVKSWFILTSVIILSCLGAINISKFNKQRLLHEQKIVESQMLVTEANNNKTDLSISSLRLAYTKMKETISVLENIPNTLGYSYNQAQDSLIKIRPVFNHLENKLQIEEQAQTTLESAQKLNAEATKLTERQTYFTENWQQARDKKQQAIDLLKTIPSNTLLDTQIKNELLTSQLAYKEIINTIRDEEIDLNYLQSAKEVAQKAASRTKTAITYYSVDSINNLLKLKSQWQLTLKLLSSVRSASISFEESQSLRKYYELNLKHANNSLEQLKKCVKYNFGSEYSCNDEVTVDIAMPPISEENDSQSSVAVTSQNNDLKGKNEAKLIETPQSPTKEEIEKALCKEIVEKYPSHPYYLDCKERGY